MIAAYAHVVFMYCESSTKMAVRCLSYWTRPRAPPYTQGRYILATLYMVPVNINKHISPAALL